MGEEDAGEEDASEGRGSGAGRASSRGNSRLTVTVSRGTSESHRVIETMLCHSAGAHMPRTASRNASRGNGSAEPGMSSFFARALLMRRASVRQRARSSRSSHSHRAFGKRSKLYRRSSTIAHVPGKSKRFSRTMTTFVARASSAAFVRVDATEPCCVDVR